MDKREQEQNKLKFEKCEIANSLVKICYITVQSRSTKRSAGVNN